MEDTSVPVCEWHAALQAALRKNRRDAHHRYCQLATLGAGGAPRNRTVVFRGFGRSETSLLAITDARSDKYSELSSDPRAEVAWYFTRSREQFRFAGQVTGLGPSSVDASDQTLRARVWQQLSESARSQFFWPHPGLPRGHGDSPEVTEAAPATFLVLELTPHWVDHLVLAKEQTRRISQWIDGAWQDSWVNP